MNIAETFRKKSNVIWERNFEHPFVQGIGNGSLDDDRFRHYLAQDYVYLINYVRFFAMGVVKGLDLEMMRRFSSFVEITINTEMDIHRGICADFGITPEELEATRPSPTCTAYTSFLLKTAYEGDMADIAAALLPCSWGYLDIAQRLKERGLPDKKHYRTWIESYASEEFVEVVDWCKDLLNRLAADVAPRKMQRLQWIFDNALQYEYLFWEMAWNREPGI
jgi:thiaminase (transcriptional activator TenA)